MTIQTQAFTPPEFQPLKICTYKHHKKKYLNKQKKKKKTVIFAGNIILNNT